MNEDAVKIIAENLKRACDEEPDHITKTDVQQHIMRLMLRMRPFPTNSDGRAYCLNMRDLAQALETVGDAFIPPPR